jgi:hypothetical protein
VKGYQAHRLSVLRIKVKISHTKVIDEEIPEDHTEAGRKNVGAFYQFSPGGSS